MEKLVKLKGVGRKTANIVLSGAFDKIEGIAVDTHVHRLSHRLGLSEEKNPEKVEQDLMQLFPREKWWAVNYLLITHGRRICEAKKANCGNCVLNVICPSAFTFNHNKKD
jgi:endonuclease-3